MSKSARWAIALAAVGALVLLFLVLRPGDDEPEPAPSSTTSTSPTPSETASRTSEAPTETTSTPDAVEVEVEVEGDRVDVKQEGEDVPGGTVQVSQGDRVVITVEADVADEVHLHGYDLKADVAPGSPATIELTADVAGIFECELEDAGRVLFELEVTP
jgi:FtsP/CotA-like multicopper oxidase with cupredoxin domain